MWPHAGADLLPHLKYAVDTGSLVFDLYEGKDVISLAGGLWEISGEFEPEELELMAEWSNRWVEDGEYTGPGYLLLKNIPSKYYSYDE